MEKQITLPLWQLEDIENTLRMCYNALDSHTKKTCLDRCVCKSWEFTKSALAKPTIETPANAPLVDVSNPVAFCGDCHEKLTLVRDGKYQCDNINCKSNVC
jgi:hypothetical protein